MDSRSPTPSAFDDDIEVPLTRPELPPSLRQRLGSWRDACTYRLIEVPPWGHRPVALTVLCAVIAASIVTGSQWTLRWWEGQQAQKSIVSVTNTTGLLVGITSALAADVDMPAPTATDLSAVNVHVAGEVRLHGMVTLPAGSRAVDAITAAGGATELADLDQVNLAQVVVDGDQVLVPAVATPEPVTTSTGITTQPDAGGPVIVEDPAASVGADAVTEQGDP